MRVFGDTAAGQRVDVFRCCALNLTAAVHGNNSGNPVSLLSMFRCVALCFAQLYFHFLVDASMLRGVFWRAWYIALCVSGRADGSDCRCFSMFRVGLACCSSGHQFRTHNPCVVDDSMCRAVFCSVVLASGGQHT